ncbi:MAG: glucokinase [Alphaproteobacteria bacterium]|nr:glucokinase [Alphaproteobacteria bacterium]
MRRLVSDIGGTNARFALVDDHGLPRDEKTLKTRDFKGVVEAARAYLGDEPVGSVVLVVAGPVEQDQIALTNCPWTFSLEETKRALGVERLLAINDFVAQALAMPRLDADDVEKLGGGEVVADRPIAVIGPGTGLGVAGLLEVDGVFRPIATEGGHVAFAPKDEVEAKVLGLLRQRFGHVSNERLLSGPGLVNFANALGELQGVELRIEHPSKVLERAERQDCPICIDAIHRFCALLGAAAGDLALTYGARGGVYLTGGMIAHLGNRFDQDRVLRAFVDKGRFENYLRAIPLYRVLRTDTGLLGAAAASLMMA